MGVLHIKNVSILDGSGKKAFKGEVCVEGNRITAVSRKKGELSPENAEVIDGQGNTLMPGLTEAHGHLSYNNSWGGKSLGLIPPEDHTLLTARHAKLILDHGFTSVRSAGSSKPRLDIAVKKEINKGHIPGPRYLAASPELTATGNLGDESQMHLYHHSGYSYIVDNPWEVRKATRMFIREGVDTIKLNIGGENWQHPGSSKMLGYTEEEIAAAADQAHEWDVWVACHTRCAEGIKIALKYGIEIIYHCDFADEESKDLLEAHKDKVFLAPALGVIYATAYDSKDWGFTPEMIESFQTIQTLESCVGVYQDLRKRGLRILPGGDYGFGWNPIGTNARDLEHFVNLLGFSPEESIMTATKWGGQIMDMGDELGLVKEGYLADLLLVKGDPAKDISILQHQDSFLMIMKDGERYKYVL